MLKTTLTLNISIEEEKINVHMHSIDQPGKVKEKYYKLASMILTTSKTIATGHGHNQRHSCYLRM